MTYIVLKVAVLLTLFINKCGISLFQFVGQPCGQHGPYTFYRALRYRAAKQKWSSLGLGQFFDVNIAIGQSESQSWLPAIGELQLLWFDRNHEGLKLASVRLYMLPENLPSGRLSTHGQV